MTMFQRTTFTDTPKWTNGNGNFAGAAVANDEEPATIWRKLRINEWTVSVSLFLFCLSMTLGKLYFNHGDCQFVNSRMLLDTGNHHIGATTDIIIELCKRYLWLIKATLGGLVITSFTWFIVYMDSRVPGVNPPSPFNSSRQRVRGSSRMHINYLIGVLHGILFIIYMCL